MRKLLMIVLLFSACGETQIEKPSTADEKLHSGYWVNTCLCRHRPFKESAQRPSSACESGFKIEAICENDSPFWCSTGEHWGYQCK